MSNRSTNPTIPSVWLASCRTQMAFLAMSALVALMAFQLTLMKTQSKFAVCAGAVIIRSRATAAVVAETSAPI
jgi:hypothetical protein